MFERARASEFVSASARRLLAEGTGAHAPAQPVDPPPGYRPGRRAPFHFSSHREAPADAHPKRSAPYGANAPASTSTRTASVSSAFRLENSGVVLTE